MTYMKCAAALAAMTLSACGGSATSNDDLLNDRLSQAQSIFDDQIAAQSVLAASDLPDDGSGRFTGPMVATGGVGDPRNDTEQTRVAFVGAADITIDFATGGISGSADDFVDVENVEDFGSDIDLVSGGAVDGTLTFEGDQATTTNASYILTANGRLEGPNDAFLDFENVLGLAEVYGDDADALQVSGTDDAEFDGEDGFVSYTGVATR